MKVRILQAKASNGARLLVGSLREAGYNALRTKVSGSAYRGVPNHLIINWGRNEYPSQWNRACTVLNKPEACAIATDKVRCFKALTEQLEHAPLYTEGLTVEREIRVHVWSGKTLDFAQKKRMSSGTREERGITEEPSDDIRNHSNGWIFARSGVTIPENAEQCASRATSAIGLDFGAVDIIITPEGVPKILEINTAPGLEGTTLENYVKAIMEIA
jgi:hypothetical protein